MAEFKLNDTIIEKVSKEDRGNVLKEMLLYTAALSNANNVSINGEKYIKTGAVTRTLMDYFGYSDEDVNKLFESNGERLQV